MAQCYSGKSRHQDKPLDPDCFSIPTSQRQMESARCAEVLADGSQDLLKDTHSKVITSRENPDHTRVGTRNLPSSVKASPIYLLFRYRTRFPIFSVDERNETAFLNVTIVMN